MKKLFIIFFAIISLTNCSYISKYSRNSDVEYLLDDEPKQEAKRVIKAVPETNLNASNLQTQKPLKKKVKIGLFLPFTSSSKDLGWALYNAALMSLFDNDINHNIELVLIDNHETPNNPADSLKDVLAQEIRLVVGPIFSSSVEKLAKDFQNNSITAISLSNNQMLLDKLANKNSSGGVFLAGFLPEQQLDKVVGYAVEHNKYNYAVIAPNSQYGITISDMVKTMVRLKDGSVITSEYYNNSESELIKAVQRLVKTFKVPNRLAEGRNNKLKKDFTIKESDKIFPQAIIIPESGKMLSKIAALIKQYNDEDRDFQLIGTAQWDDINTINDENLVGGWFASPERHRFSKFETIYYQVNGKYPPRIASIAYDSIAAIAELIDRNGQHAPDFKEFTVYKNASKNGFDGIDGTFRFLPNGLVHRNLAVLEVKKGEFVTIDKPAEKFLKY